MTRKQQRPPQQDSPALESPPRIVGGSLRGRKLLYSGDWRTRPMKDRVREAVFNLIGIDVQGKHAVDLFAGTGALGLEALSRGAVGATLVEQHFPTAELIRQNCVALEVVQRCHILPANTLLWPKRWPDLPGIPWLVFCSPPYDFYVEQSEAMLALLHGLIERAPAASLFCVEADERFAFDVLPDSNHWDIRTYPPAVVGLWTKRALPAA